MRKNKKPRTPRTGKKDATDSPALDRAWFKRARPAREVDPKLVAAYESGKFKYRGQRGPQKTPTKERVSIRLSREVLRHFRAKGAGWQTRIDRTLKAFVDAAE